MKRKRRSQEPRDVAKGLDPESVLVHNVKMAREGLDEVRRQYAEALACFDRKGVELWRWVKWIADTLEAYRGELLRLHVNVRYDARGQIAALPAEKKGVALLTLGHWAILAEMARIICPDAAGVDDTRAALEKATLEAREAGRVVGLAASVPLVEGWTDPATQDSLSRAKRFLEQQADVEGAQSFCARVRAAFEYMTGPRFQERMAYCLRDAPGAIQAFASITLSGHALNVWRHYPSVWDELSREGDAETVLADRLPGAILEASHESPTAELSPLVKGALSLAVPRLPEQERFHGEFDEFARQDEDDFELRIEREDEVARKIERGGLTPKEREVASLRFIEKLSDASIASRTGRSKSTVRGLLARAVKKLQRTAERG